MKIINWFISDTLHTYTLYTHTHTHSHTLYTPPHSIIMLRQKLKGTDTVVNRVRPSLIRGSSDITDTNFYKTFTLYISLITLNL